MSHRVFIDRIEGDLAVLEGVDAVSFTLPTTLLPPDAPEGTWLRLSLEVDPEETATAKAKVASLRDGLVDDDGEDFAL
jgi:hypothetical protein